MENVREGLLNEDAKQLVKQFNEEYSLAKVADLIKDNQIVFSELIDEKQYRVRLLNPREKDELDTLRRKKFSQLLQDKDILLEKELIRLYKERDISIEEIDNKLNLCKQQIDALNIKLAEALINKENVESFKIYRKEIEELIEKSSELEVQRNNFTMFSLENQLGDYVIKVAGYLSLDKLEGELWSRAFNNFEDFLGSNEKLVNLAIIYAIALNKIK